MICPIEAPIKISDNLAVLRFTPGYGVLFKDSIERFPSWVNTQKTVQNSIDYGQIIVRKLSFIAHNYLEIKEFFIVREEIQNKNVLWTRRSKSDTTRDRSQYHYENMRSQNFAKSLKSKLKKQAQFENSEPMTAEALKTKLIKNLKVEREQADSKSFDDLFPNGIEFEVQALEADNYDREPNYSQDMRDAQE